MHRKGINPESMCEQHDSASALMAIEVLVSTGSTNTNLSDVRRPYFRSGSYSKLRV